MAERGVIERQVLARLTQHARSLLREIALPEYDDGDIGFQFDSSTVFTDGTDFTTQLAVTRPHCDLIELKVTLLRNGESTLYFGGPDGHLDFIRTLRKAIGGCGLGGYVYLVDWANGSFIIQIEQMAVLTFAA